MDASLVSWKEAIRFWFKLGFISFGGPAGQIATVHHELVDQKKWISEKRFLHALNYCMLLPGPEALQLVIYMGWLFHRTLGGLVAGLLFILPALILLITLSIIYVVFGHTSLIEGFFLGIKPAVTAIVIQAGYKVGKRILKNKFHAMIASLAFISILFRVPYPFIIIGAALIGYLMNRFVPQAFSETNQSVSSKQGNSQDALIHEDTVRLKHTLFSYQKLLISVGISFVIWVSSFYLIQEIWGKSSVPSELSWFFTKASLLTFGGAYAVLPYVFQAAVENFHWLTTSQMMDGLALGETTPGPLIIVVSYVGFMVGHAEQFFQNSRILSGILGSLIVSWFIFLPSFCFILIGGPIIESTHQEIRLASIMTGISCAVVGVIASLSVFFAFHTIWPKEFDGGISWQGGFAIALIVMASLALMKYGQSIVRVLLACAILGLLWSQIAAPR